MNNQKKLDSQNRIGHWGDIVGPKLEIIKKFSGRRVLDVGCSTGDYVFFLNKNGYKAYGCDISSEDTWKADPKRFKIGNINHLPYEEKSFDTVIALEVFEHLSDPSIALKEISRVAKKNVILSVPNCELPQAFYPSGLAFYHEIDKTHVNRFTKKSIKDLLLKSGYTINMLTDISPIRPAILFFYALHFPEHLSAFIQKVVSKLPFYRKIYSDLIIVASL